VRGSDLCSLTVTQGMGGRMWSEEVSRRAYRRIISGTYDMVERSGVGRYEGVEDVVINEGTRLSICFVLIISREGDIHYTFML
jgi:hypothetical protein